MNPANPILSPDGKNVVHGFGDLYLNQSPLLLFGKQLRGTYPGWIRRNAIAFLDRPDEPDSRVCEYRGPDVAPVTLFSVPFNKAAYGGGRWIGTNTEQQKTYVLHPDGVVDSFDDTYAPAMSPDGAPWACLTGNNLPVHSLIVNGVEVVREREIHDTLSIVQGCVVFSIFESVNGGPKIQHTYGFMNGAVQRLHIPGRRYEIDPVAVRLPDGSIWLVSHDDTETLVRPAGSKFGYILLGAKTPHAMWDESTNTLRIVGDGETQLLDWRLSLDATRTDLSIVEKPPPPPPPPPPTNFRVTMTPDSAKGEAPLEFQTTGILLEGGPVMRWDWEVQASRSPGTWWRMRQTAEPTAQLLFDKPDVYLLRVVAFDSQGRRAETSAPRIVTVTPKKEGPIMPDVQFPPRNETMEFVVKHLNPHYRDKLNRPALYETEFNGERFSVHVDLEGQIVWTEGYLRRRVNGMPHDKACLDTMREVRGEPAPSDPS